MKRISLRHGRIELPGHRALVWHIFDSEPWRKQTCPGCGERFTEDPRFYCESEAVHMECEFEGRHPHLPEFVY